MTSRSLTTTCACCIAAMLVAPRGAIAAARGAAEQAFFGQYTPETNIDSIAALDIDQRSIVARVASGDEEGLVEARDVYSNGVTGSSSLTLKGLSTLADEKLKWSTTYQTFKDYYGGSGFADKLIEASFEGVEMPIGRGSFDFGYFDVEGRAAMIRWGVPLLNVWTHVVGCLEKAAAACLASGDNPALVADWDHAVALYTGSEVRESGDGGHLLYSLSQVECFKFGTCKKGERSPMNDKIFGNFRDGKLHLLDGNCASVESKAREIKSQMTVLLVQGLTRAIYALDVQDDYQETTQGMGAAFAAAILPLLNDCSEGYANIVENDLAPGKSLKGSYQVVKDALVRSYSCLGISCEDVGGLVDFRGSGYLLGAGACDSALPVTATSTSANTKNDPSQKTKNDTPPVLMPITAQSGVSTPLAVGLAVGLSVLSFLFGIAIACACIKRKKTAYIRRTAAGEKTAEIEATSDVVSEEPKDANEII